MEAFSLLNYWKSSSDGDASAEAKTQEEQHAHADDGPFFDLHLTLPAVNHHQHKFLQEQEQEKTHDDDDDDDECNIEYCSDEDDDDGEREELNMTLSSSCSSSSASCFSSSSNCRVQENLSSFSPPSDELFFKGKLVPIEASCSEAEAELKTTTVKPPQFSVSLMKSATKLRVFMLGLKKKSKPTTPKKNEGNTHQDNKNTSTANNNLFTEVPIVSLFTRDKSSKTSHKQENITEESQKIAKEKFLKKYGEKLWLSGQLSFKVGAKGLVNKTQEQEQGGENAVMPGKLRVVCSRLGKSRSAVVLPSGASSTVSVCSSSHASRDDSLLQQQDGIQSAILHCKTSFNASSSSSSKGALDSRGYGNDKKVKLGVQERKSL